MDLTTAAVVGAAVAVAAVVVLLAMAFYRRRDQRRRADFAITELSHRSALQDLADSDPMRWAPEPEADHRRDITTAQHRARPQIMTDAPLRQRAAREGREYRPGMYDPYTDPGHPLYQGRPVGYTPSDGSIPAVDTREGHATHRHDDGGGWNSGSSSHHDHGSSGHSSSHDSGGYSGDSGSSGGDSGGSGGGE